MDIGFIGAGKVGCSLGKFFVQNGVHVIGYYSRHIESAKDAAAFTDTLYYSDPGRLVRDCDVLFLTVPDGSIASVYNEVKQFDISDKRICHCSGAMTAREAFSDIGSYGASGYSIHPLFPVSSKKNSYQELSDAFFCIEGDETGLEDWKVFLGGLGLRVQIIPSDQKVRYHASCAMASNLMCGLIEQSIELLTDCGFSEDMALDALKPLMRSNLEHVLEKGPVEALTGPIERGDIGTVKKHLAELGRKDCDSLRGKEEQQADLALDIYRDLSRKVTELARRRHPQKDYSELEGIWKG